MTITLPLQPKEEARLLALAKAKGLTLEVIVLGALEKVLADNPATGADLIAAMQASPYKEMDLDPVRAPLPVRDVTL